VIRQDYKQLVTRGVLKFLVFNLILLLEKGMRNKREGMNQ